MDATTIGAASALAGVVVGSLAEGLRARSAFRRDKAWALYDLDRSHVEAACQALDEVKEAYGIAYGKALYTVATQSVPTSERPQITVPWARLSMLVSLYLPQLRERFAAVHKAGCDLGASMGDAIMKSGANPAIDNALMAAMGTSLKTFNDAVDLMRNDIVLLSHNLRHDAGHYAGLLK